MGPTRLALAIVLGTLAFSSSLSSAAAQRVELAGRVTASRTVLAQRRVGEPRYIAISDLFYRDRTAYLEVLDLATRTVIQIRAKRSLLERRFGVPVGAAVAIPQGEIVLYRDGVVGVAQTDAAVGTLHRTWYAELDARTGKLLRTVDLATLRDGDQLQVVGAEADGAAAWFAITRPSAHGRTLVLRRLDLGSLEGQDEQRVVLAARAGRRDHEHAVRVHAAADFSRFAIVEYVEDGVGMAPGQVHIVDPAAGTSFAVPAPPAAYGVAFSPDGRHIYLGSAQRGTISRIDVAAGRIDRQVAGPRFLHHLVISASGSRLFALSSSSSYAVYDLPDLRARSDAAHPAGVAPAMVELHGHGVASLDGAFFVAPDAEDPRRPPTDRTYVIARLVD
ncbi:MAG: lactonase family protein [Deltaproteobacteria bacterium]|nr:MAG: lactonase family protein [Deltaproteobacteria bacterium]